MGKKRIPQNNNKGEWEGEKGNSKYIFNKDFKPSSNNYGNDSDNPKTIGQMGEELGDLSPAVEFKNNYPIFNRDGGTFNGKPLEIYFDNGFIPYLNQDEIKRNEGKKLIAKSYILKLSSV